MGNFNREGKSGRRDSNRSSDGGSRRFDRRDSGRSDNRESGRFDRRDSNRSGGRDSGRRPLEMHSVTCDKCGKTCEVPFKPTSGKPVYCSDCFRKAGDGESRTPRFSQRPSENFESDKSNRNQREFDQINEKLDKILKALDLD
jgi:CxxC-x17-CxxC domain-containing protein